MMSSFLLSAFIVLSFACARFQGAQTSVIDGLCAFYNGSSCESGQCDDFPTEPCPLGASSEGRCFAIWERNSGVERLKFQGCLDHGVDRCVDDHRCVSEQPASEDGLFQCCCRQSFCNAKFATKPDTSAEHISHSDALKKTSSKNFLLKPTASSFTNSNKHESSSIISNIRFHSGRGMLGRLIKREDKREATCLSYNDADCKRDPTRCAITTESCDLRGEGTCGATWGSKGGSLHLRFMGCFNQPIEQCVDNRTCIAKPFSEIANVFVCCCRDNLCNQHLQINAFLQILEGSSLQDRLAKDQSTKEPLTNDEYGQSYCDSYVKANCDRDLFQCTPRPQACKLQQSSGRCTTVWRNESGVVELIFQGCMPSSLDTVLDDATCLADHRPSRRGLFTCSCRQNFCNRNYHIVEAASPTGATTAVVTPISTTKLTTFPALPLTAARSQNVSPSSTRLGEEHELECRQYSLGECDANSTDCQAIKVERCETRGVGKPFCVSVWSVDALGATRLHLQGCMSGNERNCRSNSECIGHHNGAVYSCCCRENLCNANFTISA